MEQTWVAARQQLRLLHQQNPDWSQPRLAQTVHMSLAWVQKWLRIFAATSPTNELVIFGRSRARKKPYSRLDPLVVERILDIRDHPPDNLQRVPGPVAIRYYLKKDKILAAAHTNPPTSTATIWKVLAENGRIHTKRYAQQHEHVPVERPPAMKSWQMDAKDVTSIIVEAGGKRQHLIEILNIIEIGGCILIASIAREDFNAQTILTTVAGILVSYGLPEEITFDNDPRFVGSASGSDFPSALRRFWHCLDVKMNQIPPHRPDLNAFVERFHKSLGQECLDKRKPIPN
jgi:hypothetical protein